MGYKYCLKELRKFTIESMSSFLGPSRTNPTLHRPANIRFFKSRVHLRDEPHFMAKRMQTPTRLVSGFLRRGSSLSQKVPDDGG